MSATTIAQYCLSYLPSRVHCSLQKRSLQVLWKGRGEQIALYIWPLGWWFLGIFSFLLLLPLHQQSFVIQIWFQVIWESKIFFRIISSLIGLLLKCYWDLVNKNQTWRTSYISKITTYVFLIFIHSRSVLTRHMFHFVGVVCLHSGNVTYFVDDCNVLSSQSAFQTYLWKWELYKLQLVNWFHIPFVLWNPAERCYGLCCVVSGCLQNARVLYSLK